MPWVVKKNESGKFCVHKEGEDSPIDGGCHASRTDAIRHMRALYANVKEFSEAHLVSENDTLSMIRPLKFAETEIAEGKLTKWIHAIPYGKWDHPIYGMSYFDSWNAETMVNNFKSGVHGTPTLHTDYDHGLDPAKGRKASGTILDMEVRDNGLYQLVEFTEEATQEILSGEWNYFSPEYHDAWENPMDSTIYSDVAKGGALTNKPWIKGMVPLNFSEVMAGIEEQEHHDPGEDPDYPDKPQDEKDGGADTGSRVDTPPNIQVEDSMELDAKVLEALGLDADATPEQIGDAVLALATEVAPLRDATAQSDAIKKFSEDYPEQAAELERLRTRDQELEAKRFSDVFRRFELKTGEGDDATTVVKGFSTVVCDKIEDIHKRFSQGAATAEHLKDVLEAVAKDGIVEYTERGSGLDATDSADAVTPQEAAKKLSELALVAITEAGGKDKLSMGDALAKVAREHPELARTYNEGRAKTRKEG